MPYDLATLAEGIKRASKAGDTEAVKKLGAAYRQLQAQAPAADSGPPQGAAPGSREYADWAAAQARAGKPLPQIEGSATPTTGQSYDKALEEVRRADYPKFTEEEFKKRTADRGVLQPLSLPEITQNDQLFSGADELSGAANALAGMFKGRDPGAVFAAYKDLQQARRDLGVERAGPAGQVASVLGSLTSFGPANPTVAAAPASLVKSVSTGAGTGAGMGGVQGFLSADGDLGQ